MTIHHQLATPIIWILFGFGGIERNYLHRRFFAVVEVDSQRWLDRSINIKALNVISNEIDMG